MGGRLKRIDYTTKDYNSILQELITQLKSAYPEHGTDFEHEDSAGRMLLEAWVYVADLMLYYLDRQANESYLPTAKERQNIINLCKLIGYKVASATPAQAKVKFTLANGAHELPVYISKGTRLSTEEKIFFELANDVVIQPGMESATGTAVEGESYTEYLVSGQNEDNQSYYLSRTGVLSVESVYVDQVKWEQVDSLTQGGPMSKIYTLEVDGASRAKIVFGDGRNGMMPEEEVQIEIVYRVGGGIRGNVATNTIINMPSLAKDRNGNSIVVTVGNPEAASGGADPEGIEHVKLWAPRFYETQGRLVTEKDYETAANTFFKQNVGKLAKSKAVMHEQSGEANIVRIYALAYGEDGSVVTPAEAICEEFIRSIEEIKVFTDTVEIVSGSTREVDVKGTVKILGGFKKNEILEKIKNSLKKLLSPEERDMGQELRLSDLHRAVDETDGVDWVEFSNPTATVMTSAYELLVLGQFEFEFV